MPQLKGRTRKPSGQKKAGSRVIQRYNRRIKKWVKIDRSGKRPKIKGTSKTKFTGIPTK